MSRQAVKKATNFTTLVLIGALIIFSVYGYQKGIFTSRDQLLGTASVYCDSDCTGCHSGDSGRTDLSGRSRLFRTLVWIFIQRCRDYHWFLH